MHNAKSRMRIFFLMTGLILFAACLSGCYGARPPGVKRPGGQSGYNPKSQEEIESEVQAIKDLMESKPDVPAEETYIDNQKPSLNLKIVVVSTLDEEENKDIYLIDETGLNPRRLTNFESVESFPCITDDGKRVFFVSDMDGQERENPFQIFTEIYVMDIDTEEITRLTYDDRMDYGLSVSGDGSRIVYMTQEMGQEGYENPQMILMDGDGKNQKAIQDEALKNCLPRISGDGNWIVFNSNRYGPYNIFLIDLSKPENIKTKALTDSIISEYYPNINYDGTVIVYEKILNGVQDETMYEIYRINRDGKNEVGITNDKFCDSFPALTNDGQTVVFVSKRWDWDDDGHLNEALYMMNIDGSNLRKISKHPAYFEQPDV